MFDSIILNEEEMEEEHEQNARCNVVSVCIGSIFKDEDNSNQDNEIKCKYSKSANETPLFRKNAENEVGTLLRQEAVMALRTILEALTEYVSGTDGDF